MADRAKLFLTIDAASHGRNRRIASLHEAGDHKGVESQLREAFGPGIDLHVHTLPRVRPPADSTLEADELLDEVVIGLDWMPRADADALLTLIATGKLPGIEAGIDLPIAPGEMWCPGGAASPLFGTLDRALALIRTDVLVGSGTNGTDVGGAGVHVVVIDQGLDPGYFEADNILHDDKTPRGFAVDLQPNGGGMVRMPWTTDYGHGTRMATLVAAVARNAFLYDMPLLPDRIRDLPNFLSVATAAMKTLRRHFWARAKVNGQKTGALAHPGPWVLCNAWSVYSLDEDLPTGNPGNYATNPKHPFTKEMLKLSMPQPTPDPPPLPNFEPFPGPNIVFAAGNCGQFCPDARCGASTIGLGNGIFGVAAMTRVLTVGAVRNDGTWLGYSSQGPAPSSTAVDPDLLPIFGEIKPDLCAPSQFGDPADARPAYTGTSAACALAAGAIAALRSSNLLGITSEPYPLIVSLREGAMPVAGQDNPGDHEAGDNRVGSGILNLAGMVPATTSAPDA